MHVNPDIDPTHLNHKERAGLYLYSAINLVRRQYFLTADLPALDPTTAQAERAGMAGVSVLAAAGLAVLEIKTHIPSNLAIQIFSSGYDAS